MEGGEAVAVKDVSLAQSCAATQELKSGDDELTPDEREVGSSTLPSEADERVRCTRVLGSAWLRGHYQPATEGRGSHRLPARCKPASPPSQVCEESREGRTTSGSSARPSMMSTLCDQLTFSVAEATTFDWNI